MMRLNPVRSALEPEITRSLSEVPHHDVGTAAIILQDITRSCEGVVIHEVN